MYMRIISYLFIAAIFVEYIFFRQKLIFNAHALGGIGRGEYRNDLEAFQSSYKKGYMYYEVDIVETKDGFLVASHNADKISRITLEEFMNSEKKTVLDLDDIFALMKRHTEIHMMFDYLPGFYNENIPVQMKKMAKRIQDSGVYERSVLEVYSKENLDAVCETGFSNIQMFILPYRQRRAPFISIEDYICYLQKKNVGIVSYTYADVIRHPAEILKLKQNGFKIYSGVWNSILRLWLYPQTRFLDVITTDLLTPVKNKSKIKK